MSFGARLATAFFCVVFGIGFGFAAATWPDSRTRWMLWLIAAFCFIVVTCCFPGKHSAITNRIVGGTVFLLYVVYLIQEIKEGQWASWSRAKPNVLNAFRGLIIWGLPAGYIMVYGRLPYNPFQVSPYADSEDTSESHDEDRHYLRK
jgi:Ca2+/Na+ antiporter